MKRGDVLVGEAREVIVGKCRIEMAAVAIHALAQGALEIFRRPAADADS